MVMHIPCMKNVAFSNPTLDADVWSAVENQLKSRRFSVSVCTSNASVSGGVPWLQLWDYFFIGELGVTTARRSSWKFRQFSNIVSDVVLHVWAVRTLNDLKRHQHVGSVNKALLPVMVKHDKPCDTWKWPQAILCESKWSDIPFSCAVKARQPRCVDLVSRRTHCSEKLTPPFGACKQASACTVILHQNWVKNRTEVKWKEHRVDFGQTCNSRFSSHLAHLTWKVSTTMTAQLSYYLEHHLAHLSTSDHSDSSIVMLSRLSAGCSSLFWWQNLPLSHMSGRQIRFTSFLRSCGRWDWRLDHS